MKAKSLCDAFRGEEGSFVGSELGRVHLDLALAAGTIGLPQTVSAYTWIHDPQCESTHR